MSYICVGRNKHKQTTNFMPSFVIDDVSLVRTIKAQIYGHRIVQLFPNLNSSHYLATNLG
jgi:hypothetical protein